MKGEDLGVKLFVPDDEKALEIFRCIKWSEGVHCPDCHSDKVYKRGFVRKTPVRRYSCNECGKNFTDLTGTIFYNKKLPMGEMLYIMANLDKKSVNRLSKELGHKWESVYRLSKDFKECLAKKSPDPILSGDIEIDEMYYSAGEKGLKKTNPDEEAPGTKTNHQSSL
ncbi:MAG: transposase [Methanobacteriaceae archaeon]|nr:transposase [Methanobacteriaceae archaeon]